MKVKEEPKSAEKTTPVHSFFGECAGDSFPLGWLQLHKIHLQGYMWKYFLSSGQKGMGPVFQLGVCPLDMQAVVGATHICTFFLGFFCHESISMTIQFVPLIY